MAKRKPRILTDEVRGKRWVRAWKEGRGHGEYVVQIWNSGTPDGKPDGDWGMPGILGLELSIVQALAQTK